MNVDIVVVNWNSRDDTLQCLASLAPQVAAQPGARVLLVDNGSTDGSVAAVAAAQREVVTIELRENRGFTGGVNAGVEAGSSEAIAFLNNDAMVEPGWLSSLVRTLQQAPPDVAAVGGRIIDITGTRIDFIGGVMTFDGHAFQRGFRRPIGSVAEPAPLDELLFACGGNMIVRRSIFEELGGFDDDYFAYLEDVDFGWRSWLSGFRTIYAPDALVRHKSSATSDRLGSFERGVLFERNALQTMVKNLDEQSFAAALSPTLLTLLHRLHRYVIDRNGDTTALTRPPFTKKRRSLFSRREATHISDPLTEMQFRATEWFFQNSDRIMEKRRRVQSRRRRSDEEIFTRFPLHYIPTYHGDESLFSSQLFRALRLDVPSVEQSLSEMMAQ